MKFVYKGLLPLFIGMALISCAGTDTSTLKKEVENPNLFKAGTSIADTLASRMPEFARSVFKKTLDSVPGEYYYYATNGRIDSLIQKEGEQYKAVVTIAYNSPNGQNNYEIKSGNLSYNVKNGVLDAELDFPRYIKKYWSNGKPKDILTGFLYRDDQGVIKVDSGRSEVYFESGKIYQQNAWKDKQPVTSRQWNENGTLTREIDFPKYIKTYWDNGNPQNVLTGLVYIDNQGNFQMDSGRSEIYFESGKIKEQSDWKNKQGIASKQWNENGVLVAELDFPKHLKKYWDNGNPQNVLAGILYRNDHGNFAIANGREEIYSEAGKLIEQTDWNNKQPIACKKWNENGMLTMEVDFQTSCIEYWNNGKIKQKGEGVLYRKDDTNDCRVDSGRSEVYFEDGKIKQHNEWKNKLLVKQKEWNKNGVLLKEFVIPEYFKEYYDNGKIKKELTGLYWASLTNVEVENGYKKDYYENGKTKVLVNYKEKKPYSSKQWSEDGALSMEWDIPAGYSKYYEDGRLRLEKKGSLYLGEKDVLLESGYQILYFKNGKPQFQEQYENKQTIGKKIWDENGTLVIEEDLSKGFRKAYFPNGKISRNISGKFYYENKNIIFEDCSVKIWYENGQTKALLNYKEKKLISKTLWYPNGNLSITAELPNHYKVFYEDGKIKADVTGTIVEENGTFKIKDGVYNEYDPSGEIKASATYKDFQVISKKK